MESNSSGINNATQNKPFIPMPFIFFSGMFVEEKPFDPHAFYLIDVILRASVTGVIALFGMVANILNVIIFIRQGILSEGSTVSLFGLATADFFSCLFNALSNCFVIIMWFAPNVGSWSWEVEDFYYAIAIRPRTIFSQVICWITAYIAIERFISVVFPFKVKQILNPKRSCFIIASIFVVTTGLYYPQYIRLKLTKLNLPWSGPKLKYLDLGTISREHYNIFLYVHPVALRAVSVAIVLLCNIVIMWKVVISTKFRKTSANTPGNKDTPSTAGSNPNSDKKGENTADTSKDSAKPAAKINKDSKEQKLLRMMVIICVVFLICTTPDIIYVFVLYVGSTKYHWYIQETAFTVSTLFEIVGSSINIFIYYSLSTRYRKEFNACCLRWKNDKKMTSSAFTSGDSASSTKVVTSITTKQ